MIKAIMCKICKNKHLDHYECSECGMRLGFFSPASTIIRGEIFVWKYCPNCGNVLRPDLIEENKNV